MKLCYNHPVLDNAAQFIHITYDANRSPIQSNIATFSILKLSNAFLTTSFLVYPSFQHPYTTIQRMFSKMTFTRIPHY